MVKNVGKGGFESCEFRTLSKQTHGYADEAHPVRKLLGSQQHTDTHTHVHVKHLEIILELPSHFLFILFIKRMLEDYFGIDRNRTKEKKPLPLFAQMIWSSEFMLHF